MKMNVILNHVAEASALTLWAHTDATATMVSNLLCKMENADVLVSVRQKVFSYSQVVDFYYN